MDTFNQYATIIVLVVTVFGLPSTISRWRMAFRYYGRVCFHTARNLWTYALRSAHSFHLIGALVLHVFTGMGEVRWLIKDEPYPRWLCLAVLLWSWRLIADRICPPMALFISSSSKRAVERRGWFTFNFRRYRLLSFLAPREHVNAIAFQAHFGDDLRVRRGPGWRIPVYHLMDVVPMVMADVCEHSRMFEKEVHTLVENGLGSKVRFLTNGDLPTWIKAKYDTVDLKPICIKYEDIDKVLTKTALSAHKLEQRQSLQDEYTYLFRAIPRAARPDLGLRDAQITALAILDREYSRFLKAYKGVRLSELNSRLVEELPSIVSRNKEDEYLRANRALQIADGISLGRWEELQTKPGDWANLHRASLETKLGKLNRFRRHWESALDHLNAAQGVLRDMLNRGTGDVDFQIVAAELGDALFLEGEVWTVQFLDAPTEEKRLRGLRCFREALEIDQSLNREDPAVFLRIRLLEGSTDHGRRRPRQ